MCLDPCGGAVNPGTLAWMYIWLQHKFYFLMQVKRIARNCQCALRFFIVFYSKIYNMKSINLKYGIIIKSVSLNPLQYFPKLLNLLQHIHTHIHVHTNRNTSTILYFVSIILYYTYINYIKYCSLVNIKFI